MRPGITFQYKTAIFGASPLTEVEVWTDAPGIVEVVEAFKSFLLACGFQPETIKDAFNEVDE